jgi:hypothetical protein
MNLSQGKTVDEQGKEEIEICRTLMNGEKRDKMR